MIALASVFQTNFNAILVLIVMKFQSNTFLGRKIKFQNGIHGKSYIHSKEFLGSSCRATIYSKKETCTYTMDNYSNSFNKPFSLKYN